MYPDGCDAKHSGVMGVFVRLMSAPKSTRASYQMFLVPARRASDALPVADACRDRCQRVHVPRYESVCTQ